MIHVCKKKNAADGRHTFANLTTSAARETDQQPCSSCDEVDRLAQGFSPPAKDRWPADLPLWRLIASWSHLKPLSAFYVKTDK